MEKLSRRCVLKSLSYVGGVAVINPLLSFIMSGKAMMRRRVPSSAKQLPVIGLVHGFNLM